MSAVLLAQPDLQVSPGVLAPRDPRVLLERKVDRERKDLKAQLEETVFRDLWVCQDLEDLLDHLGRTETRESLESRARKEARVTKESTVHLVPPALKGLLEHPVLLAQMESPVPEVSRACSARREMKGQGDSRDLQVQSGCRACPDRLERKVKPATLVKWVPPAPLVPEARQDPREPMALRDLLAVSETRVLLEKREILVKQESQVFRENSAHQVLEENEEKRESPVRLAQLDLLALKVPLEMTVPKAAQVQVVSPVTLVPLESPVPLGWTVPPVTRETMERLVKLVLLDPPESRVPPDHLGREAPLESQDPREDKERRETRERPAWKVPKERQVLLVPKDHLASPVLKASGASLAQLESKVFLVPRAQMDHPDQWVLPDYPA